MTKRVGKKEILRIMRNNYLMYLEDAYLSLGACINASTRLNKALFKAKIIRALQDVKHLIMDLEELKKSSLVGEDWKYLDSILTCLTFAQITLDELRYGYFEGFEDIIMDKLVNEALDRIIMSYNEVNIKIKWLSN